MDKLTYTLREQMVRNLLDEILDKSIEGDFKAVRKAAKKIHKLAQQNVEE